MRKSNQENQHRKSQQSVVKRVIVFISNNDRQPGIANIVSILMFGATVWLAMITLHVFNQTTRQTKIADSSAKAAKISADAAKLSADLQKQALDSQISAKKQSDAADAKKLKRDTDFINKQKEGIDSQISALKETQREFDIENRPLIQILDIGFDTLQENKKVVINYNFINYGKQPVKIFKNELSPQITTYDYYEPIPNQLPGIQQLNVYLSGSAISNNKYKSSDIIRKGECDSIKQGKIFIFLTGKLCF